MQKVRADAGLGGNIRALRIAAGMTQEQVAAKLQLAGCDVSRSIYSQIECGSYSLRVCEIVALKRIFGVDYNAIFAGLEE